MRPHREDFYGCGCCGRQVGPEVEWCIDCRAHIIDTPVPAWARTYEAHTGRPCPFAEPEPPLTPEEIRDGEIFEEFEYLDGGEQQ